MATTYKILRAVSKERAAYAPLTELEASSAEQAIRAAVQAQPGDNRDGVYVAVPARSWTEQAVVLETKPRVVLSDPPGRPTLVESTEPAADATKASGS